MALSTVPFKRYAEGRYNLIDLDTVPPEKRQDYEIRNQNIEAGKPLCRKCDGTGNEIYTRYRRCSKCGGTGIANGN